MGTSSSRQVMDSVAETTQKVLTDIVTNNQNLITVNTVNLQNANITCGDNCTIECEGGLTLKNTIQGNTTIIGKFKNTSTTKIKSDLTAALQQQVEQKFNKTIGVGGGWGTMNSDENISSIKSMINTTVENNITTSNLNSILNNTMSVQNAGITLGNNSKIKGELCTITNENIQKLQIQLVAKNISEQIGDTIVKSSLVQKATQSYTYKAEGLEALLGPLVLMVIAIVIGVIIFFTVGAKQFTNPKFIGTVAVLIAVVLGTTYGLKWWPFNKKSTKHWGCEKDKDNLFTGKCISYNNEKDGPFDTQELCDKANKEAIPICGNIYGCDYDKYIKSDGSDSQCKPVSKPTAYTYNDQNTCSSAANRCQKWYVCDKDHPDQKDNCNCEAVFFNPDIDTHDHYISKDVCCDNLSCKTSS